MDLLDFASVAACQDGVRRPAAHVRRPAARVPRAGAVLVVLGLVWLWRRPQLRPLALTSALRASSSGSSRDGPTTPIPAMLPALVAGCLALAERRPRRLTLAGLGVLHVAVLALALPLVVPVLPTCQLVSTGTWDRSFWKDEIGWHELVAQPPTAWRSRTPAERAAAAIVAGNYGVAGALSLLRPGRGPAHAGLGAPLLPVLASGEDAASARSCWSASTARTRSGGARTRPSWPWPTTAGTSTTKSVAGRSSGAGCAAARSAVGEHVRHCAAVTRSSGTRGVCHLAAPPRQREESPCQIRRARCRGTGAAADAHAGA